MIGQRCSLGPSTVPLALADLHVLELRLKGHLPPRVAAHHEALISRFVLLWAHVDRDRAQVIPLYFLICWFGDIEFLAIQLQLCELYHFVIGCNRLLHKIWVVSPDRVRLGGL